MRHELYAQILSKLEDVVVAFAAVDRCCASLLLLPLLPLSLLLFMPLRMRARAVAFSSFTPIPSHQCTVVVVVVSVIVDVVVDVRFS